MEKRQIEKLAYGPMPKGSNFRSAGYVNVQILPPKVVELLGAGDVVLSLQRTPGTGDVMFVATRYGKAIEIPAQNGKKE